MRAAFVQTLIEIARKDTRVCLLTADLGYTVVEDFYKEFPDRFFNVGVAEQNMIGVATALAKEGLIPFVYSIANFASLRPYEFIKNGPAAHNLPVRIIGIGSGFDYGFAGATHYGLDDVGVMRLQKNITIIVPADPVQTKAALLKTYNLPGPVYYRIGKGCKYTVDSLGGAFDLGCVNEIAEGNDLVFVCMGGMTKQVIEAANVLKEKKITSSVVVVSSFCSSANKELLRVLKKHKVVFTVEDHNVVGGLGSYICEVAAENDLSCKVVRKGIELESNGIVGSREFMNEKYGLTSQVLVENVMKILSEIKNEKTTSLSNTSYS